MIAEHALTVPERVPSFIFRFEEIGRGDIPRVGGKNASLGEMVRALGPEGVDVPPGFATSAEAYWHFIAFNGLREPIERALAGWKSGRMTLEAAGEAIRDGFLSARWPDDLAEAIADAYDALSRATGCEAAGVAVRSSATAEDLPTASFAGQQETFLHIAGHAPLLDACRRCYASLFTDRAISYRDLNGFDHLKVALSIGVQKMVRSDLGGAGVMFSIDPETGFDKAVLINAGWGLGETVVKGMADPDEYVVFAPLLDTPGLSPIVEKQCGGKAIKMIYGRGKSAPTRIVRTQKKERSAFVLTDGEILALARWAVRIAAHYGCPMDMEWGKDGETGKLYLLQARPETVRSRANTAKLRRWRFREKGRLLVSGIAIGDAIATGKVRRIARPDEGAHFSDGDILVAPTTDPDWMPIMRRASAIVTDHGGRTSHAAIVSRELGLSAVVGTGNATAVLWDGQEVSISCAEGDAGFVYEGKARFDVEELDVAALPETRTRVMLNMANPAAAFRWWQLPSDGVGLARMEFVVNQHVRIHPMALVRFDALKDKAARAEIEKLTYGYADKCDYFVERLALGLSRIAAAHYPKPVIVRMSDFKTNEYARLIGGAAFEPHEENPMIGFRGASRYYDPRYREGFALECRAIRRLRNEMGFRNVIVMIPFCRTVAEADRVLAEMAASGLQRGEDGLKVYVMCEIPSNVVCARAFAARFDGFSIGGNDLTQLTLGVDRDSASLAALFDERDDAVTWMIRTAIGEARGAGIPVGFCGQAPSDRPDFAEFLVECGITSVSVTPDSFAAVKRHIAAAEARIPKDALLKKSV